MSHSFSASEFSCLHIENLMGFLEVKLTKVWESPLRLAFLEFLAPKLVDYETSAIHHVEFKVLLHLLAPVKGFCPW